MQGSYSGGGGRPLADQEGALALSPQTSPIGNPPGHRRGKEWSAPDPRPGSGGRLTRPDDGEQGFHEQRRRGDRGGCQAIPHNAAAVGAESDTDRPQGKQHRSGAKSGLGYSSAMEPPKREEDRGW